MNALRTFRKEHGLTQEQLADRIGGISVGSLSRLENGDQWPSAEMARRIMEATDGKVTPNDFLNSFAGQPNSDSAVNRSAA
jgi:transcriptional regulator with XRE-family HTH domain